MNDAFVSAHSEPRLLNCPNSDRNSDVAEPELVDVGFATNAVRAGQQRGSEGEHCDPIYTTSSFVFTSAADAKSRFVDDADGNIYSRFTNPTVQAFEQRLAALESGQFATATGSGMAAIQLVGLGILKAGDHVVASAGLFGSTVTLFRKMFGKFGVETSFVDLSDVDKWKAAIRPNTRMLFLETPSNPLCELADIRALSEVAHANDALLVVDNCFCTPALQQPLKLGADVVVHSATKFLDGQGRCVGGAIVHNSESLRDELTALMRCSGPSLSPFNAWVFHKGLETLKLRMRAHCDGALKVAQWLERHPCVKKVYYPGLASHPQHDLARSQQSGFGGVVSFEVRGGREAAWHVINSTRLLSITANLGDTKTTITHPATTTHGRLTPEDRTAAGISDELVRVSVGLEEIDDIIADLGRGLKQQCNQVVTEQTSTVVSESVSAHQYGVVIEASELQSILTRNEPGAPEIQIVDVSSAQQYAAEHIPGAVNFSYNHLVTGEDPAAGKLPPLVDLKEQLEVAGISSDRPMVVYDAEGTGKAARFCWTMDVLGFENWSLLNGGIDAWDKNARAISRDAVILPRAIFDVKDCREHRLATLDDVLTLHSSDRVKILDARTHAEFTGEDRRAERAGRIPGSRNLNWLDTMDPLDSGRLRDPKLLRKILCELELSPDLEIITYCQTHHRSSQSYVMLKWLGYKRIRGYAGSWSEWGNRNDTPVQTG